MPITIFFFSIGSIHLVTSNVVMDYKISPGNAARCTLKYEKKMRKKLVPILIHFQFGNENLKLLRLCKQPKND